MEFQELIDLIADEYGAEPVIIKKIKNLVKSELVKSNGIYHISNGILIDISNDPDEKYEGFHLIILFPNGYGCSVVWNYGSYGYKDDKFELAVVKHHNYEYYDLWYDSPTDICQGDVEGWLTAKEAFDKIKVIGQIR